MEKDFFKHSPLAKKVKIPLRIVLEKREMSARQLASLKSEGEIQLKEPLCQLLAGEKILGTGRLIEKEGKLQFQMNEEQEEDRG